MTVIWPNTKFGMKTKYFTVLCVNIRLYLFSTTPNSVKYLKYYHLSNASHTDQSYKSWSTQLLSLVFGIQQPSYTTCWYGKRTKRKQRVLQLAFESLTKWVKRVRSIILLTFCKTHNVYFSLSFHVFCFDVSACSSSWLTGIKLSR